MEINVKLILSYESGDIEVFRKGKLETIKGIAGLLLCICAVAGIYYWESYGRIRYEKTEIVVLKYALAPNARIQKDQLIYVNRDKSTLIDNPIRDPGLIVGKVAKHYIPAGMQLSEKFFEAEGLLPGQGEYIFQMPSEWIASYPSTLRRSDNAYIYPIRLKHSEISDAERENNLAELKQSAERDDEAPIQCMKIAFVKNQSNQEVESVGEDGRLNGSSNIATIELIAEIDDITRLNTLYKDGYKFMILYK